MKNKDKLIAFIISLIICAFITIDFLRILGFPSFYDYGVLIIGILTLMSLLLSIKKIYLTKDYLIYSILIFYLLLIGIELSHSGFIYFYILLEHTVWITLPLIFVIYNGRGLKKVKIIAYYFILMNFFVAIPSVLLHLIDLPVATTVGTIGRDSGYYGNPNINGMVNAMVIILLLWLYSKKEKTNYLYYLLLAFAFLVSFSCVLLSGCRSAMIAIIFAIVVLFLKKFKSTVARILISFFSVILMSFVIILRKGLIYKGRNIFSNDLDTFLHIISSGRYDLVKDFIILIDKHYLLGRGINSIHGLVVTYTNKLHTKELIEYSLNNFHNIFINIMYYSGIFALLSFFVILIIYIYKLIKNSQRDIYAILVVVVGFIIAQLDVPLLYSTSVINIIWWLFLEYSGVKQ